MLILLALLRVLSFGGLEFAMHLVWMAVVVLFVVWLPCRRSESTSVTAGQAYASRIPLA